MKSPKIQRWIDLLASLLARRLPVTFEELIPDVPAYAAGDQSPETRRRMFERDKDELRAYGAGILSSYGEIEEFRGMEIRPLDFHAMATIEYDITKYQPVLFAAESMGHLVESVGSFFASCDDETLVRLEPAPSKA